MQLRTKIMSKLWRFLISLAIGFAVGLVTYGIARGVQQPVKLLFVFPGIGLLIGVHYWHKWLTGSGFSWKAFWNKEPLDEDDDEVK